MVEGAAEQSAAGRAPVLHSAGMRLNTSCLQMGTCGQLPVQTAPSSATWPSHTNGPPSSSSACGFLRAERGCQPPAGARQWLLAR
jgi:hypothetical protein